MRTNILTNRLIKQILLPRNWLLFIRELDIRKLEQERQGYLISGLGRLVTSITKVLFHSIQKKKFIKL